MSPNLRIKNNYPQHLPTPPSKNTLRFSEDPFHPWRRFELCTVIPWQPWQRVTVNHWPLPTGLVPWRHGTPAGCWGWVVGWPGVGGWGVRATFEGFAKKVSRYMTVFICLIKHGFKRWFLDDAIEAIHWRCFVHLVEIAASYSEFNHWWSS